jgi:endonuclease/exonuclease/phosphatase family metal-dependent hydrolase
LRLRLATFNTENLFARFRFAARVDPRRAEHEGFTIDDLAFGIYDAGQKHLTAGVIAATDADVVALQEVEGLDALKRFRDRYLGGAARYPHVMCIDGNDPRFIDVAVLSRFPIVHARSWQHLAGPTGLVFSRDCLETVVDVPGVAPLTLFVNHFKSMRSPRDPERGRVTTAPTRTEQATAVRTIVAEHFADRVHTAFFAVLGDLNDYRGDDERGACAITALLDWDALVDPVLELPVDDRWTHYAAPGVGHPEPQYRQLDYLLLSRGLDARRVGPPTIVRSGLARNATRYPGARLAGVGPDRPNASDHGATVVELDLPEGARA